MAFTPRTFEQILDDMIAYVQANTIVSDFTVGSVARTILEAAALEDDEQYFQMVQLLDAFRISTSRGADLDRRLAEFGIARRAPTTATCRVRFFNSNLITEQLAQDQATGSTSLTLFDTDEFPTSGFPYTVRVAEGTTRVQDVSVTANDTVLNVLTLDAGTPLDNDMVVGDRVSLVTGATAQVINTGSSLQAPPTVNEAPKLFATQEPAFIAAGNFFSNEVIVRAQVSGTKGNVGAGRITQFIGGAPFPGAGVINTSAASGGSNRESDFDFRQRALDQLQALSRGTPLALRTAAIGVTDPNTGQRTVSANITEDFSQNEVIVYIDDGSGLTPDVQTLASGTIDTGGGDLAVGSGVIVLDDTSNFPSSGTLLIDNDGVNGAELVEYVSKNDGLNNLTLATTTTIAHQNSTTVFFIDSLTASAEAGRRRFSFQNPPVVRGTDRVFTNPGSGWIELTPGVDYVLNRGTGEIQLVSLAGLGAGSQLVAHYSYYTNLIATVQKVLEGDLDRAAAFPGVKAAGIFLSVEAPTIRRVTVVASISAEVGFTEAGLVDSVRTEIETYINALKIGEDVIRSKIIDVAHNIPGVRDIFVTLPAGNVTILENELPVPFDSDGSSLVTIL